MAERKLLTFGTHKSNNHKGFLFVLYFSFILTAALIMLNSGANRVFAASPVTCGINTGNSTDYAAAVIELQVQSSDSSVAPVTAQGASATITDKVEYPNGRSNILSYDVTTQKIVSGPQDSVTLSQHSGITCQNPNNGNTYVNPVVLAYTTGATSSIGGYASPGSYVLDCDELASGGALATFSITGSGTPTNATAGGTWDTQTIQPANGGTAYTIVTYKEKQALVPLTGEVDENYAHNGLPGAEVWLTDSTTPKYTGPLYTVQTGPTEGIYSTSILTGDHFQIDMTHFTNPSGYSGAYTDPNLSSTASRYNCNSSEYPNQVAGSSPSNSSCTDIRSVTNDAYNFIYNSSSTSSCGGLSSSGSGSTYTVSASYTTANGVSYKSVSFNWGDGTTISGGTNSNGVVRSAPHTYSGSGTYAVIATLSFNSSSTSTCQTTIIVGGGGNPTAPILACTAGGGAYNITLNTNPTPTGGYIGAGYPSPTLWFTSSGGFDSDANHGLSLAPYSDQTSQLIVDGNSSLGLPSSGPTDFTGSNSNIGGLTYPINNSAGVYNVNYEANIVSVISNPAYPNDPVITQQTPTPPVVYQTETQNPVPVFTTTADIGSPTSAYYTKEVVTTTYIYTNTVTGPNTSEGTVTGSSRPTLGSNETSAGPIALASSTTSSQPITSSTVGTDPTIQTITYENSTTNTYTEPTTITTPGTTTSGTTTYSCSPGWSGPSGGRCSRVEKNGTTTYTGETATTSPSTTSPSTTTPSSESSQTVTDNYQYIVTITTTTTTNTNTTNWITYATNPTVSCPAATIQIADQPYMKVYGGDVVAGSGFASGSGTSCTEPTSSSIIGWNWPQPPKYSGAGDEFAAYALGNINGFATNQASANGGVTALSFANNNPNNNNPSSGLFGGYFVPVNCAPDFFGTMPTSTISPVPSSPNNLTTQSYYSGSGVTINGGNVQDSQHPTIYVAGNAYITGNINLGTNPGGNWSSISAIPSFELIVKGNIYIDPGVTNLDGIYVAQGGTIYDCATASGPVSINDSSFYDTCNNKLTVNGSFIGTNVDLMRTNNTLYQSSSDSSNAGGGSSSNAAEVFNYNPVIWLGLTTNNTNLNNYDSVTSLPPVL